MAYFIFLYIDIRIHVKRAKKAVKQREERIRIYQDQLAKAQVIDYFQLTIIFNEQ